MMGVPGGATGWTLARSAQAGCTWKGHGDVDEVCEAANHPRRRGIIWSMDAARELVAPTLLLAMPQVLDPFFHRSVILLVHHDDDGSFGFVVNRSTAVLVAEVLRTMEIPWAGDPSCATFFGGPVQPQLGTVLYRTAGELSPTSAEVAPGLVLTQDVGDLTRLASAPPADLKLFLGYAGWGEGQLIEEILRNDWLIASVDPVLIFDPAPETVWERALATVGVDPATLPAWTEAQDEEIAN